MTIDPSTGEAGYSGKRRVGYRAVSPRTSLGRRHQCECGSPATIEFFSRQVPGEPAEFCKMTRCQRPVKRGRPPCRPKVEVIRVS